MESSKKVFVHFGGDTEEYPDHDICHNCDSKEKRCFGLFRKKVPNNKITSTNYTFLTFLPMSIFDLYTRIANIYFTFFVVLSLTKYSSVSWIFSIPPLLIVFSLSILKELYEFLNIRSEDKKENHKISNKYDLEQQKWVEIKREHIKQGDILLIRKSEDIPADILLANSNILSNICSISTTNLDGETNMKIKKSFCGSELLENTAGDITDSKLTPNLRGFIKSTPPSANMNFNGWKAAIHLSSDGEAKEIPLDMDNLILRGCVLKNTEWIVAIVVFTGEETKIQQQSQLGKPVIKTKSEKKLDLFILALLMFGVGIVVAFCYLNFYFYQAPNIWYFFGDIPSKSEYFTYAFSVMIMTQSILPISLYVSIEFSKLIHSFAINIDENMMDSEKKSHAKTRTSVLTDELGRVNVIFSDKTGTLTKNKMEFSHCSIGDECYKIEKTPSGFSNGRLESLLAQNDNAVSEFFRLLSLCHSVYPERHDSHGVSYQAESPDEKALLLMAKDFSHALQKRYYHKEGGENAEFLEVDISGAEKQFRIMEYFSFDSDRKRSAIIVDEIGRDGPLTLYMKGAESMVYKFLDEESQERYDGKTKDFIDEFSQKGLRILLVAYKKIDREAYGEWKEAYSESKMGFEESTSDLVNQIESGLTLLGSTAVEDELQDEVSSTLKSFKKAKIAVWILTGDKMQTALNIAKSCGILTPEMRFYPNIILFDLYDNESDETTLVKIQSILKKAAKDIEPKGENSADQIMVITGRMLEILYPKKTDKNKDYIVEIECREIMLEILKKCRVIICCRVSPFQKSQLVSIYKTQYPKNIILAVGDGANDVPMLKLANIGVGIAGKEGLQASRSADFAVSEFKSLKTLILYHGSINYRRIAKLINYSLYKNIAITFILLCYILDNGFSNSLILPQDSTNMHNIIYTNVPILMITLFDRPYTWSNSQKNPILYTINSRQRILTFSALLIHSLKAILHAGVVYVVHLFVFSPAYIGSDGTGLPFCLVSYSIFGSILAVVTIEAFLESENGSIYTLIALYFTLPAWLVLSAALSYASTAFENQGCFHVALMQPCMWVAMFLSAIFCCLPRVLILFFWTYNNPDDLQIIKELEMIDKEAKMRFVEEKVVAVAKRRRDSTIGHREFDSSKRETALWKKFVEAKLITPFLRMD